MFDGFIRIVALIVESEGTFGKDDEFERLVTGSGHMESTGENQIAVKETMHIEARTKGFNLGFISVCRTNGFLCNRHI